MDAQYDLAFLYDNGYGLQLDYTAARTWYRKAAEQGHVTAQWNLGAIYANGLGVPEDLDTAIAWYRKAVDQGHVTAQYDLGILYSSGKGIEKDDVQALFLINQQLIRLRHRLSIKAIVIRSVPPKQRPQSTPVHALI